MRYLFLLILLVLSPDLFAQAGALPIDSIDVILPILMQFRNEARKHQVYDADAILSKNLGGIYIINQNQMSSLSKSTTLTPLGLVKMKTSKGLFGYIYVGPTIYVQDNVLQHPNSLKWVLYHELGHVLGLPHSDGIMAPAHLLGENIKDWDKLLNDFFQKVKELPPGSHKEKHDNTHI